MNYYDQKQTIAKVNKQDRVIGTIDKWEAHQKGILHRAFTLCLFYNDYILLQHRKHPVFDGVFDLSGSSHQLMIGDKVEDTIESAFNTFKREWRSGVLQGKLTDVGAVYYKAKDPNSVYVEHEICHLVVGRLKTLPSPVLEYAYGYSLMTKAVILNKKAPIRKTLAPWVLKLLPLLG